MPRATAGKQKRIERRRDRPYPKQKKVRSRKKAQAEKGKGLLAEGLRGRTREREKTQSI